jgi:hypothetical protein|tara:strand:+ start:594 stop:1310 length:717 start_codon:yes stop_codon:yes gene_type:complete
MRKALQPYVNQYVLGRGWITDWEEMDNGVTRVFVEQPTLRKPNKHILFDNQEIISTEHHLNLFIDKDWLEGTDNWKAEKYKQIDFTGIIQHYTRANGTHDFGVYPTPQSTLHNRLDLLADTTEMIGKNFKISPETLGWAEHAMPPILNEYLRHLENAGDRLPTFNGTYDYYKKEIIEWLDAADYISKTIRSICSNRALRRRHKAKNFLPWYDSIPVEGNTDIQDVIEWFGTPALATTA